MINLSVTGIIHSFHYFDREFWLSYKALEATMDPTKWESVKLVLLKSKKVDPKILDGLNMQEYDLKRAELDTEWTKKNEEARLTGITTHELIRNLLVTNLYDTSKEYGLQGELLTPDLFLASTGGLFPELKIEVPLDDQYQLIGIADLILIHDGIFDIIDWKTDEDGIKFKSHFDLAKKHAKKMKYPLSKFDDVNGIHYLLQLSMYAWLVKQLRPDLKLGKLLLVWIKDMKVKKVYDLEYLEKDIDQLIKWHLKATKLKVKTDLCREIKYF